MGESTQKCVLEFCASQLHVDLIQIGPTAHRERELNFLSSHFPNLKALEGCYLPQCRNLHGSISVCKFRQQTFLGGTVSVLGKQDMGEDLNLLS